jgi:hypothetical protein
MNGNSSKIKPLFNPYQPTQRGSTSTIFIQS